MTDDRQSEDARAVAQMEADVGLEHIADVYAQALVAAAENTGATEDVLAEFGHFVAEVLDAYPKFDAVLASGLVSVDEKTALLDRTLSGRVPSLLLNFFKVVARHDRLDCLRVILRQARLLDDRRRGRVPVKVLTASPLSGDLADRMVRSLRTILGIEPIVQQAVDPQLIGGAVVRVGDTVYDGSIANQLKIVRQQMIDRSIHEIQSRRDRFRSTTGSRTV